MERGDDVAWRMLQNVSYAPEPADEGLELLACLWIVAVGRLEELHELLLVYAKCRK